MSRVVTGIAHGMQFPKALPHPSATCCGVVPVWETSFALCSGGGISVLVRSYLQSKGCWWEMLGAGQPSSTSRACGRNKIPPLVAAPAGLCPEAAVGMKGTVSVLALSWLWPVPDIRVHGADQSGLELPVLLCHGVWASSRGWW